MTSNILSVLVLFLVGFQAGRVVAGEWGLPKDPSNCHIVIFAGQSNN